MAGCGTWVEWRTDEDVQERNAGVEPRRRVRERAPVVTSDGWVWFEGINGALMKMSVTAANQTQAAPSPTGPFVTTTDGWVWFQGANGALAKCTRTERSNQISVTI